jgi:hypothetical protein
MSTSNEPETAERFVPAIEDLLALANQPIPLTSTDRAPLVAVGLYYHLVNQATALMLLRSDRFDLACAPLRRSLIEHMLYLIWLADAGDAAVDAMNRGLQHQQHRLRDSISAADVSVGTAEQRATMDAVIDAAVPASDHERLQHITHLLEAYPLSPMLKSLWRTESGWAHPSLHVMQLYVEQRPDATVLHQQPYHEQFADHTPATCFLTLYFATLALDALLGNPWTEQLTSIAERYDMPTALPTRQTPQDSDGTPRIGPGAVRAN